MARREWKMDRWQDGQKEELKDKQIATCNGQIEKVRQIDREPEKECRSDKYLSSF